MFCVTRYSLTTAQIISRLAHRGSVEVERVLRRLCGLKWRIPLCGESALVLVQSGHSTRGTPHGCRVGEATPALKLGIHPEIERPAILKRSMPSTAGVTIGMPPAPVGNEANFQLQEEYTRWEAVSPGSAKKIPNLVFK
jgi:hypothetical protein